MGQTADVPQHFAVIEIVSAHGGGGADDELGGLAAGDDDGRAPTSGLFAGLAPELFAGAFVHYRDE